MERKIKKRNTTAALKVKTAWTKEKTLLLIRDFKKLPSLWDCSHVHYHLRLKKKTALKSLQDKYHLKFYEIKKKFRSLCTYFTRLHNKFLNNPQEKPNWFAYDAMSFIANYQQANVSSNSISQYIIEEVEDVKEVEEVQDGGSEICARDWVDCNALGHGDLQVDFSNNNTEKIGAGVGFAYNRVLPLHEY